MYAIFETGGKQYKVAPGNLLDVDKLTPQTVPTADSDDSTEQNPAQSAEIIFSKVVCFADGEDVRFGTPYVDNAKVVASIVEQRKAKKINIIKIKRRKHHMKRIGHRQLLTRIRIQSIECN